MVAESNMFYPKRVIWRKKEISSFFFFKKGFTIVIVISVNSM